MAYANELDAKVWVFHPGAKTRHQPILRGAEWKQNVRSIQELYLASEEYGLNIALENLPGKYWFLMHKPEEFTRFYRETNLPIGIVLDLGHAHLEGQIEPFFNLLADKMVHMHASDNDGSDDQHLGIGKGKIDYEWFKQTVNKIGYDKSVIIESITDVPESPKTKTASFLIRFKRHLDFHEILSYHCVGENFLCLSSSNVALGILR